MSRLRLLLAAGAVPLLAAVPAFGDVPKLQCVRVGGHAVTTATVCPRDVLAANIGELTGGGVNVDQLRLDICDLLEDLLPPEAYDALCNGTYTGSEICATVMNDLDTNFTEEEKEQLLRICTPTAFLCETTGVSCPADPTRDLVP